jgi:hypothetical protein
MHGVVRKIGVPLFRIVLIAAGAKIFEVRAADCPVANALATTAL